MKSYTSLLDKKSILKRKNIEGFAVTFYQKGPKVAVQIETIDVDTYPDLATAEKMATAFIKSYKDLLR